MAICINMGEYKSLTLSKRDKSKNAKFKNRSGHMMSCLEIHMRMGKFIRKIQAWFHIKFRSTLNPSRKERSRYNQRNHTESYWGKVRIMLLPFGLWVSSLNSTNFMLLCMYVTYDNLKEIFPQFDKKWVYKPIWPDTSQRKISE